MPNPEKLEINLALDFVYYPLEENKHLHEKKL